MTFRLPNDSHHVAIAGKNGTGKTLAALWHVSKRPFENRPELIVDFKGDDHIALLDAEEIPVGSIPERAGLFVVRPQVSDVAAILPTLEGIYNRGNCGLYIDEGFIMGHNKPVEGMFENLLTQGRSKRIPLITLIQRPVWVSRFVMTESTFFQLFKLQDKRDYATLAQVVPERALIRVPDFHSVYYDSGRDTVDFLSPVPPEDEIIGRINARVAAMRSKRAPRFI